LYQSFTGSRAAASGEGANEADGAFSSPEREDLGGGVDGIQVDEAPGAAPLVADLAEELLHAIRLVGGQPELVDRHLHDGGVGAVGIEVDGDEHDVVTPGRHLAVPEDVGIAAGVETQVAIELQRAVLAADPVDPGDVADQVAGRAERCLLFCDDLSFHGAEDGYIALKVALDGSVSTTSENLLIYATSNRRHLMPEYMAENLETKYVGEEIHPGETVEEKISLSERFGLWVTFYPFDQDEYLDIVQHWLKTLDAKWSDAAREEALQWSLQRGSRSGRVAYQFARDWAGRHPKK